MLFSMLPYKFLEIVISKYDKVHIYLQQLPEIIQVVISGTGTERLAAFDIVE